MHFITHLAIDTAHLYNTGPMLLVFFVMMFYGVLHNIVTLSGAPFMFYLIGKINLRNILSFSLTIVVFTWFSMQ